MKILILSLLLSFSAFSSTLVEKSKGLRFLALEAEEYNFFRDIYLHDQIEQRAKEICKLYKQGHLVDYRVKERQISGFVATITNGILDKKVVGPKSLLFIPVNPYVFDWVECEEFSIQR